MKGYAACVLSLCLAAGASAGAQDSTAHQGDLCFRGRPFPRCESFFLIEVEAGGPLGTTRHSTSAGSVPDFNRYVQFNMGFMGNVGGRDSAHAIGGVAEFTPVMGDLDQERLAIVVRRRTWFANKLIELGAGPLAARQLKPAAPFAYGATIEAAAGYGDLVALTAGLDLAANRDHRTASFRAGVRLGSFPAVVVTALAAALVPRD